jgi:hypothetical protein
MNRAYPLSPVPHAAWNVGSVINNCVPIGASAPSAARPWARSRDAVPDRFGASIESVILVLKKAQAICRISARAGLHGGCGGGSRFATAVHRSLGESRINVSLYNLDGLLGNGLALSCWALALGNACL